MYRLREAEPDFAAAWDAAVEEGTDLLEDEARRRAVEGVIKERGVYYRGDLVGTEIEINYSDGLMTTLLKARRPDVYRERTETVHKGDPSAPIQVVEFRRHEQADGR